jgi:hypothetical protein
MVSTKVAAAATCVALAAAAVPLASAANSWTPTAEMTRARSHMTTTPLADGRVLVAGRGGTGDVYAPATNSWTATGPSAFPLVGGSVLAPVPGRRVLSVGGERLANCSPRGCSSEPSATAELYTP